MSNSYSPPILVMQIEALVDSGHLSSRSDVVKESLRFMIEKKNHLRYASAVEIYKKGKATLTKKVLKLQAFHQIILEES